ncbi:MAG: head-tail connector protein [Sarcina sp.]
MLNEVKEYLNIELEHDLDDNLLKSLIEAGKIYLSNAGVKVVEENEQYKLVLKMIVSQMYESRIDGNTDKNPSYCLSLQSLIIQLVNC